MYKEENCGCGGHAQYHGEHYDESRGGDCGRGGYRHHGMYGQWYHQDYCGCGCHRGGVGFQRGFIRREEVIDNLEEYLKDLQSEAKGIEERIAELKKKSESQPA